jgi:hypothetical protein
MILVQDHCLRVCVYMYICAHACTCVFTSAHMKVTCVFEETSQKFLHSLYFCA